MDVLINDPFFSAGFMALGLGLLFIEVFVPSGGILGILAVGSMLLGIYGFFHQGRPAYAVGAVVIAIGFSVWTLRFALRRLSFSTSLGPETSTSASEELPSLLGKEGVTVTPLRPAGVAQIDGRRVDVVATGKFVERNRKVRVVDTSGNRVVVREIENTEG